ncbi:cell adhesion molecule Dscam2-like [Palaemon carinicauda]|uniref:cell adhesion molecule Dscam2-like n=1 Tax=Palaemon carinicauda TaxID=392227 RepID=UPI0035B67741
MGIKVGNTSLNSYFPPRYPASWRSSSYVVFLFLVLIYTQNKRLDASIGCDALREGPRIIQEPPAVVTFPNTRGASLTCVASATPAPTITWVTADGARADNMGGLRMVMSSHGNSTLTLLPFSPDQYRHDIHVATYRCLASNSVGSVTSRSISVNAGGKLEPGIAQGDQEALDWTASALAVLLSCQGFTNWNEEVDEPVRYRSVISTAQGMTVLTSIQYAREAAIVVVCA